MNILKFNKNKIFYFCSNKSILFNKHIAPVSVLSFKTSPQNLRPICYSRNYDYKSDTKQNSFNFSNILPLIPILLYGSYRKVECETKSINLSINIKSIKCSMFSTRLIMFVDNRFFIAAKRNMPNELKR
jgi:hypothetical protein